MAHPFDLNSGPPALLVMYLRPPRTPNCMAGRGALGYAERNGVVLVGGVGYQRSPMHHIESIEEEEVEREERSPYRT